MDLGQVTTADINGGTIDNTNIVVGTGKTLNVAAGTITLNAAQIPATAISHATFGAGSAYSFLGSTIADLGQVTTANIDGGTVDATAIGGTTAAAGAFTTLSTSTGNKITIGDVGANTASSGHAVTIHFQMGTITSYTANLGAGSTQTIALSSNRITTSSRIFAQAVTCSTGHLGVISATQSGAGSANIIVKNHHTSACTSSYKIYFLVL